MLTEKRLSKHTLLIAMTANTYGDDIKNCMDAGMNGHLAKPIEPQKLYQTIEQKLANGTEHPIR